MKTNYKKFSKLISCVMAMVLVVISCSSLLTLVSAEVDTTDSTTTEYIDSFNAGTTVYADNFEGDALNSQWQAVCNEAACNTVSVSDGSATITSTSTSNTGVRLTKYLNGDEYKKSSQYVSSEFISTDDTVKPTLWVRLNYTGNHTHFAAQYLSGYYLQYGCGGQEIYISRLNNSYETTRIGSIAYNQYTTIAQNTRVKMEFSAVGSNPVVLTARILAYNDTSRKWEVKYNKTFYDSSESLLQSGTAGFGSAASANTSVSIDSFNYRTTDNVLESSLYNDDFSIDGTCLSGDWKPVQTTNANAYTTVSGGYATFDATESNKGIRTTRYLDGDKYLKTDQSAALEFVNTTGAYPALWVRFQHDTSKTGDNCYQGLQGYFMFYSQNDDQLYLRRQNSNNKTTSIATIYNPLGSKKTEAVRVRLELNVTGINPTVINARFLIFNDTTGNWEQKFSNTYLDNDNDTSDNKYQLTEPGTVAMGFGGSSTTFQVDNFAYASAEGVATNYYAEKDCTESIESSFGQIISLDKGSSYRLSAKRKDDVVSQSSLWVEYKDDISGAVTNNSRLIKNLSDCTLSEKEGYYIMSADFTVPTAAKSANNGVSNDTHVFVGFRYSDLNREAVLTDFELYKLDDSGNPTGPNLIFNPDFKMGLYGWIDNFGDGSSYTTSFSSAFGTSTSNNNRVNANSCTEEELNEIFKAPDALTYLPNTYYKLTTDKSLTIGYVGGSVTCGYGATDENGERNNAGQEINSWRALTTKWFKEQYADAQITDFSAAIGSTGSLSAAYRYEKEVAVNNPDLLFIEFAINDRYDTGTLTADEQYQHSLRYTESLIKKAYADNPNIEIVVCLTADAWVRGQKYANYMAIRDLAEHYGFMCIDINGKFLSNLTFKSNSNYEDVSEDISWKTYFCYTENETEMIDNVHPNNVGYKKYFDVIKEKLATDLTNIDPANAPTGVYAKQLPAQLYEGNLVINADYSNPVNLNMVYNNGWNVVESSFSSLGYINTNYSPSKDYYNYYIESDTVGSKFTFNFNGTDLGLFVVRGVDYGQVNITVDGTTNYTLNCNGTATGDTDHAANVCINNLSEGIHKVVIEFTNIENNAGKKFRIGTFLINGNVEKAPELSAVKSGILNSTEFDDINGDGVFDIRDLVARGETINSIPKK